MPRVPKEYRKTKIVVEGKGHFPTDMLRDDSCCPHTPKDTILIEGFSATPRQIVLTRFSLDGKKTCAERWLAFGWKVVYDEGA